VGFTVLTAFVPDFDPEDPETFFFAAIDALQTGQPVGSCRPGKRPL
jgi:hypothetical protein